MNEFDAEAWRISPEQARKIHEAQHRGRLPRIEGDFAPTTLAQLRDRNWDDRLPSWLRLYFYLVIKSRRGTEVVTLGNARVSEIGLSRFQKYRALERLQMLGLIEVLQLPRSAPRIRVLWHE